MSTVLFENLCFCMNPRKFRFSQKNAKKLTFVLKNFKWMLQTYTQYLYQSNKDGYIFLDKNQNKNICKNRNFVTFWYLLRDTNIQRSVTFFHLFRNSERC